MSRLILAELYKESRKISFKVFTLLIVFVSVFSLILINKNLKLDSEQVMVYPQYSLEEYKDVNKYGSYEQYLKDYSEYEETISKILKKNEVNQNTRVKVLFEYYPTFLFVVGIVIIYIAFHIFSYDFQSKSIRYLFMSDKGRTKILFSKIITVILLAIYFSMIIFIVFILILSIITKENIFLDGIYIGDNLKFIPTILYYLVKTFIYLIPLSFISIVTIFFTVLLNGNTFALIFSNIIYFCSLLFSQILINYGYTIVKYTFLPYLDFTYFDNIASVSINNLIYNMNLSLVNGLLIVGIYGICFIYMSIKLMKRDV